MLWTMLLGLGTRHERTLAGLRRTQERVTGESLVADQVLGAVDTRLHTARAPGVRRPARGCHRRGGAPARRGSTIPRVALGRTETGFPGRFPAPSVPVCALAPAPAAGAHKASRSRSRRPGVPARRARPGRLLAYPRALRSWRRPCRASCSALSSHAHTRLTRSRASAPIAVV